MAFDTATEQTKPGSIEPPPGIQSRSAAAVPGITGGSGPKLHALVAVTVPGARGRRVAEPAGRESRRPKFATLKPMSIPPEHKMPVSGRAVDDLSFYRTEPVSFVRRGSRLNGRQAEAWERTSSKYIIDPPRDRADTSVAEGYEFDQQALYGRKAPLIVEIGSGLGEAMAFAASANPDKDFLAVEVYRPGLAALMVRVENNELTNVRAVQANAPEVLDSLLPPASASEVWVFFSDPWHKVRHHKRRLIKDSFVRKLEQVLVPGGVVRLATDWSNYAEQMREVFDAAPAFTSMHPGELSGEDSNLTKVRRLGLEGEVTDPDFVDERGGWAPRFEGRTLTSFENKALKAGRLVFDLAYRKAP